MPKKYPVKKVDTYKLKGGKLNLESDYLIKASEISKYYQKNKNIHIDGGRLGGLNILSNIKKFSDYDKCRNFIFYKTTSLSAYINLGLVSIREVYHTVKLNLGIDSGLITELYWRDFITIFYISFLISREVVLRKYMIKLNGKMIKICFKSVLMGKQVFPW